MRHRIVAFWITLWICCHQGVIAWNTGLQNPPPPKGQGRTFKVKTELVEVRAVVTDRQGRLVENLKREDFELLENNRAQEIDFFSITRVEGEESRPPAGGAAAPGRSAESKSIRARLTEPPARTVILFVDTLHLSVASLMQAKQALRKFIDERLTERDMVALVTSGSSLGIAEQFTRDKQLLRYAIERIGPGPTSRASFFTPYLASCVEHGDTEAMNVAIALLRLEDGLSGDRRSMEQMARGRASQVLSEASYLRKATLFTLKALAEQMTALPGQRLMAIFSDGFTLQDSGGRAQTSELQSVISRAVRSGVAIYSIDAKGLQPPPLFNASMRGGAAGPSLESYVSASEREEQDGINSLAVDTGGELFVNTNDLGGALGKALDANRSYYVLGYYLGNAGDNRPYRRILVRVRNHPEYIVRAPKGYFTSDIGKGVSDEAEKTPQQRLIQAIHAPMPQTGLYVSASADYIESDGDDAQITLTIRLEGENLQYREKDQRHLMELGIVSEIYDANGKRVHFLSEGVQVSLAPERLALAKNNGYRISRRLKLKPGVYQVRIGVREIDTDRIGTSNAWVEVPNLARRKLALSSLILLDSPGTESTPTNDGGLGAVARSRMVQGVRLYPPNQACAFYLRVQQTSKSPAGSALIFQTELLQRGKPVMQGEWRAVSAGAKDNKGISLSGQVNLAGFGPGIYELRVTVQDPQSKQTAQRTAILGIE
jgi:VWFA-related protein